MMKKFLLTIICILTSVSIASAKELIAYSHLTDGYWQIWVMDPDGKNHQPVTQSPSDKRNPVWFRDEAKIAYRTNNSELWVIDIQSREEIQYLKQFGVISNPEFFKTSDEVIFVRFDPRLSDSTEIWRSNMDGSNSIILTRDRLPKFEPDLSPDESSIVFIKSEADRKNYHIWQMDANGENARQLTEGKSFDLFPHFSPDQKTVVFASNRADKNYELYTLEIESRTLTRLTHEPGLEGHPSFSPDGEKITFASNRGGNQQIWVINKDGSNPQQLTFDQEESIDPAWGNPKEGTK